MEYIDTLKLQQQGEKCLMDNPPECRQKCPLKFDVRKFIEKMKDQNYLAAYKLYNSAVMFPDIVSRICTCHCSNADTLDSKKCEVDIRALERACCEMISDKKMAPRYIPKKRSKVVIIGGGIGGLTCGLKLSQRGYEVILYEKSNRLGGSLFSNELLSEEVINDEIERACGASKLRYNLKMEICDLKELDFDAAYIATGRYGNKFGLEIENNNGVFFATNKEDSSLRPIYDASQAATIIDTWIKIHKMEPVCEKDFSSDSYCSKYKNSILTEEEIQEEVKKCKLCKCDKCIQVCEQMQHFKKQPLKIIRDINSSLNIVDTITTRVASRQLNSCNQCGLCAKVCPVGLDFEQIFLRSKVQLQETGHLPPAYHDFWLRELEYTQSEEAFLAYAEDIDKCEYVFFPGCSLGSSSPKYVIETFKIIKKILGNKLGIILSCCGAPAIWAGQLDREKAVIDQIKSELGKMGNPKLILACSSCHKYLKNSFEEEQMVSLYELLAQKLEIVQRDFQKSVSVFDPCSSKGEKNIQNSVRILLNKLGHKIIEIKYGVDEKRCCGYGGQNQAVNRELIDEIALKRVSENNYDYVTYCANCNEVFAQREKRTAHILDLLFELTEEDYENDMQREVTSFTIQHYNKRVVKNELEKMLNVKCTNQKEYNIKTNDMINVKISKEVYHSMDRQLILEDDAIRTIRYCEETNNKLLDQDSGNFIGHLKEGYITYWVVYKKEPEGYGLLKIYCHRMSIEEG